MTTGNETKCWREMRKGSIDELNVTVKPTMTGRHALEIRVLDRVVVHKNFESKPGKCSINVVTYCILIYPERNSIFFQYVNKVLHVRYC